jgi:hypothetical protein
VVDEAQLFAPAVAGEVSDEARKLSLGAMTNLMCRGRKRGLAGVIATQRLAKLAKNVAAEASNFLSIRPALLKPIPFPSMRYTECGPCKHRRIRRLRPQRAFRKPAGQHR